MTAIVYVGSRLLVLISLLHFYWFFGGKWAEGKVTPNNKQGESILPSRPIIFLSALMFLVAALIPLGGLNLLPFDVPQELYIVLLVLGLIAYVIRGFLGLLLSLRTKKPRNQETKNRL